MEKQMIGPKEEKTHDQEREGEKSKIKSHYSWSHTFGFPSLSTHLNTHALQLPLGSMNIENVLMDKRFFFDSELFKVHLKLRFHTFDVQLTKFKVSYKDRGIAKISF